MDGFGGLLLRRLNNAVSASYHACIANYGRMDMHPRLVLVALLMLVFSTNIAADPGGGGGGCQYWQCAPDGLGSADCRTAICGAICDPSFQYAATCDVIHDGPGYWCEFEFCYDV